MERIEAQENSRVAIAKGIVTQDLAVVDSNLRLIANLRLLQWYLDSGNPAQREQLAKFFLSLVRESRIYDKVRYLDASGQEVIRINYNDGKPAIVPREQLQNKSGRYYFNDTFKLNRGEVFVSPLDLNIEHDSLEIPHKPMIRFGTPVFDSAGRKKGVILLNYLGSDLLHHLREAMQGGDPHSGMLLNRDGYWLSGAKREDEWGFMLGKSERTFGHDFAEEWRTISAAEQGALRTDKGLFVYTTVYPLLSGQHSSAGSTLANAPSQQELAAREYYWKIVSFVPNTVLSGTAFYNLPSDRILLVIVYLLLALAAWIIASVTLSREQARNKLQLFRDLVEHSSDGISIVDPATGRFLDANEALCHDLGYTRAELLQRSVMDIQGNINDEAAWQAHTQALRTQGKALIEFETLRKDGSRFPAEVSLCHVVVANHAYILSNVRDITERKRAEASLRESEERFYGAFEHAAIGMAIVATDGRWLRVNQALCDIVGYSADELLTKTFQDITHPDDLETDLGYVRQLLAGEIQTYQMEKRYFHKSGRIVWILLSVSLVRDDQGKPLHFIPQIQDITEHKQAEQELKNLSDRLQHILASTLAVHYACRIDGERFVPTFASANMPAVWGYDSAAFLGNAGWWWSCLHPAERDGIVAGLSAALGEASRSQFAHEYRFRHKDGNYRWVHDEMQIIRDQAAQPQEIVGSWLDITERKQAEDELKRHAQIDLLTGLNNRRHFYDLAELELARAKRYDMPLSVLMLDVDHFKSVNDTYGHHAGDMVLRKLSEVCVQTLRGIDIAGRLGGEEFAILLPETNSEQALEVAERLRLAIADTAVPFDQGGSIHFTVSIGVALYMATDARVDDVLKRADAALYAAKNAGRNRVCGEGAG